MVPEDGLTQWIAPLPVSALRIDNKTSRRLAAHGTDPHRRSCLAAARAGYAWICGGWIAKPRRSRSVSPVRCSEAERIAVLFAKGVEQVDAGFGIEALRLVAYVTEDLPSEQLGGGLTIRQEDALADLFSRLGNRLGFDRVLRLLPAQSKIPERSFLLAPAAYSVAETPPLRAGTERPIILFPPEPVMAPRMDQPGHPPAKFRWRRMQFTTLRATRPERIAPEW